jgi:hypothetical protein
MMFCVKISIYIHLEKLNMLKVSHYFMKLAIEHCYNFINTLIFLKVMVMWSIKNNDSVASLHCKLFETSWNYISLISANIPSSSTNYNYIIFRKVIR